MECPCCEEEVPNLVRLEFPLECKACEYVFDDQAYFRIQELEEKLREANNSIWIAYKTLNYIAWIGDDLIADSNKSASDLCTDAVKRIGKKVICPDSTKG